MFGQFELEEFKGINLPQKAQSAWSAVFDNPELIGAKFIPLLYLGKQLAHGTNYSFIVQRSIVYRDEVFRNILRVTINELDDKYTFSEDLKII